MRTRPAQNRPARTAPEGPAGELAALRNLGPTSARWLAEAGIPDAKTLRRLGPVAAYRRVKAMRPNEATLNLLDALAGALLDLPFARLPAEIKAALRAELAAPPPARNRFKRDADRGRQRRSR